MFGNIVGVQLLSVCATPAIVCGRSGRRLRRAIEKIAISLFLFFYGWDSGGCSRRSFFQPQVRVTYGDRGSDPRTIGRPPTVRRPLVPCPPLDCLGCCPFVLLLQTKPNGL